MVKRLCATKRGERPRSLASVSLPPDRAVRGAAQPVGGQALPPARAAGTYRTFAWGRAPQRCAAAAEGPAEVGPNGPSRRPPNLTASARRPADTRPARPNWHNRPCAGPGSSARPRGGEADPDPTLACSRAAPSGGRFPLRRLTAIRDGRSWRRDPLAGPTTTEDPISRRSIRVRTLGRAGQQGCIPPPLASPARLHPSQPGPHPTSPARRGSPATGRVYWGQ
jgi:hypothetical protein